MMRTIAAGKREKIAHIIWLTASVLVMVMMVSPVASLVCDTKPAKPSSNATRAPEMAEPNFCDIVPEEKISPVDDVPFFSVA